MFSSANWFLSTNRETQASCFFLFFLFFRRKNEYRKPQTPFTPDHKTLGVESKLTRTVTVGRVVTFSLTCQQGELQHSDIWMTLERRWDETQSGQRKNSEKTLYLYQFVHHKPHLDWPGLEPRPPVVGSRQLIAWARPVTLITKVTAEPTVTGVTFPAMIILLLVIPRCCGYMNAPQCFALCTHRVWLILHLTNFNLHIGT